MIVVDTSGALAALDATEPLHERALRVLAEDRGPRLLSPFVLAELDFLIARQGTGPELALLDEVRRGVYRLEPFGDDDVGLARSVMARYADLRVGLADASVVVLAARHATNRLLTLDERHFRVLRPLSGTESFRILPADA